MDFEAFVSQSDFTALQSCKFTRKTSQKKRRAPFQRLEVNNSSNSGSQIEFIEQAGGFTAGDIPFDASVDT
ncbi:hypothetical protein MAR_020370, partial [Mya arenaria]